MLLVYRKKAVGAYLLEKPSGTVIGLKDAQTAMAQAEQQDAQQVSGEDYSGDWGERHDEELGAAGQSQQTERKYEQKTIMAHSVLYPYGPRFTRLSVSTPRGAA